MALFDVVFEGGGAKGSAFVGALRALESRGHETRRLVGTSAGAITATLLAAGYTPDEMLAAVNERLGNKPRFASFMDEPLADQFDEPVRRNSHTMHVLEEAPLTVPDVVKRGLLKGLFQVPLYPQLFCFVECGGIFAGVAFEKWLEEKLAVKGVDATDTFRSMFDKKHRDLTLVASDTTDMEMRFLNHRTAPDVPVIYAVRMSMSIPFVWREVVWRGEWGRYRDRDMTGHTIVDGGVLSNFPISLIADRVPDLMGDTDPAGALNLGLLLDENAPVPGVPADPPKRVHQLKVVQRVSRLVDTMTGARDNEDMRRHARAICRLPVKGYGTTEFDMAEAKLKALVDCGFATMAAHLDERPDVPRPAQVPSPGSA